MEGKSGLTTLSATGHRPNKLGGYTRQTSDLLTEFAVHAIRRINPKKGISGMALGWDLAVARAFIQLGIEWTAAVPFNGQELAWPHHSQIQYQGVLKRASEVVIVCDGSYHPNKMQLRNEWMVNHSSDILSLWDGSSGGTGNCMRYAEQMPIQIHNVWDEWKQFESMYKV